MPPLIRFAFVLAVCLFLVGLASPALAQCRGGACRVSQSAYQPVAVYRVEAFPSQPGQPAEFLPGEYQVAAVGPGVVRSTVRVVRLTSAPVRRIKGLLSRTRFFDGDGRPLFRARQ